MTNIAKLQYRREFDTYIDFILTEYLLEVYEQGSQTPICVTRHLFEQWLAENGRFSYVEDVYFGGEWITIHRYGLAVDYWNFCDRSQIIADIREYLSTL